MSSFHGQPGKLPAKSASRVETVSALAALGALGGGTVALAAGLWPRAAIVVVAVSYLAVSWALTRGLSR